LTLVRGLFKRATIVATKKTLRVNQNFIQNIYEMHFVSGFDSRQRLIQTSDHCRDEENASSKSKFYIEYLQNAFYEQF
jgi:hypothetical protein